MTMRRSRCYDMQADEAVLAEIQALAAPGVVTLATLHELRCLDLSHWRDKADLLHALFKSSLSNETYAAAAAEFDACRRTNAQGVMAAAPPREAEGQTSMAVQPLREARGRPAKPKTCAPRSHAQLHPPSESVVPGGAQPAGTTISDDSGTWGAGALLDDADDGTAALLQAASRKATAPAEQGAATTVAKRERGRSAGGSSEAPKKRGRPKKSKKVGAARPESATQPAPTASGAATRFVWGAHRCTATGFRPSVQATGAGRNSADKATDSAAVNRRLGRTRPQAVRRSTLLSPGTLR